MEKVNKLKKKGYKGLTDTRRQTPWEKFGRKTTKIWLESGSVKERERKAFWKVWKGEEHVKKLVLKKKLSKQFSINWNLDSINRKSHSIDLASIELWSS